MWGWLIIPVLAFSMAVSGPLPVSDGIHDTSTLGDGIAYLDGLTWGRTDAGRTVIVGHGDRAFSDLHTLQVGDEIALFMGDYEPMRFEVFNIVWVTPDDTRVFTLPPSEYELVLMTCSTNERYRLIVQARLK